MKPQKITALVYLYAVLVSGCGGPSSEGFQFNFTPILSTPPATPQVVSVKPGRLGGQLELTWNQTQANHDQSAYYRGFAIYMASESGVTKNNYRNLADGRRFSTTDTSKTINCLSAQKRYYFAVTARTESGGFLLVTTSESSESPEVSASPTPAPRPSSPTGLTATAGVGEITLQWQENPATEHIAFYTLYMAATPWRTWSEDLPGARRFSHLSQSSGVVISNLTANTEYWFALTATCDQESFATVPVSATTVEPGTWARLAPLPVKQTGAVAGVINDQFYIAGTACCPLQGRLDIYDAVTDSWYPGTHLTVPRTYAASGVINNYLYRVGGMDEHHQRTAVLERYDPMSDSWLRLAPMPTPRSNAVAGVINDQLYVAGGIDADGNALTRVEVYNPADNTWSLRAPLPVSRINVAAGVIADQLYVAGGNRSDATATLLRYNLADDRWETKTPMPIPVWNAAAAVMDDKLFVAGGDQYRMLQVYDPAKDSWTIQTPLISGRSAAVAGSMNGKIYVAGGTPNENSTLEAFTP